MARRMYRALGLATGAPTIETTTRRRPTRRIFRQLSGTADVPPEPRGGRVWRTFAPSAVADYKSVATATWLTGNNGAGTNCIYYHYTTPNDRTTSVSYIMNPIRWTCDVPVSSGGYYDYWHAPTSPGVAKEAVIDLNPLPQLVAGKFLVGLSQEIVPIGSHIEAGAVQQLEFPASTVDRLRAEPAPTLFNPSTRKYQFAAGFQAIAPTLPVSLNYGASPKYIQHRKNGAATGSFKTNPTVTDYRVTLAVGDTYELDVWYEVRTTAMAIAPGTPAKACIWLPTSIVGSGSTRFQQRSVAFFGYDFSPNYDHLRQTYRMDLTGSHTWKLTNGTNSQNMVSAGQWIAQQVPGLIRWTPPTTHVISVIEFYYDCEVPVISIKHRSTGAVAYYRPSTGSLYHSTTVDRNSGNVVQSDYHGTFNQAGGTTFTRVQAGGHKGHVSVLPSPTGDFPATIDLTRVTL